MRMRGRLDHGGEVWNLEGSIRFLQPNLEGPASPEEHRKEYPAGQMPTPERQNCLVTWCLVCIEASFLDCKHCTPED